MGIFGNSLFTMLPEADMHGWLQLGGKRGDGEWVYAALPRLHDGLYVYKNDIASEPRFIVPLDGPGQLRLGIEGTSGTYVVTSGCGFRARISLWLASLLLRLLLLASIYLHLLPIFCLPPLLSCPLCLYLNVRRCCQSLPIPLPSALFRLAPTLRFLLSLPYFNTPAPPSFPRYPYMAPTYIHRD